MITAERMLSVAVVTGFFTSMRACLNDRLTGNELSVSGAQISTWAGQTEQASSGALTCDFFVSFFSAMPIPTPPRHHRFLPDSYFSSCCAGMGVILGPFIEAMLLQVARTFGLIPDNRMA